MNITHSMIQYLNKGFQNENINFKTIAILENVKETY